MSDLYDALKVIKSKEFVDLTHSFKAGIPHWQGFADMTAETVYHYDEGVGTRGSGFLAHLYGHVGQWGTHVDPPAHFIKDGRFLDELSVKDMICPLAVLNVSEKAKKNPDYAAQPFDLEEWEARNGRLPEGAFVILRTDWHKRWPHAAALANADEKGVNHFPGWGMELLKVLIEDRRVKAVGHETTDTDPGCTGSLPCETYVLSKDIYQIELLDNTDKLPEWGSVIVASWPKPYQGSGFPARAFAILPY